jgi:RNA polymerase sigma factor (sigma-70 family)
MVAAIKRGDEKAYREAFFLHQQKLYAFFLKKCGSKEDSRDMVQTVFLKLWQYRDSLNPEYALGQHIFQIARTVFIDYLRKENKIQNSLGYSVGDVPENLAATPDAFDLRQKLGKALESMPEMRKRAFELSRIEGYSYMEIASIFSISVKSVDNHVTKAVRHLRKVFLWAAIMEAFVC